MEGLKAVAKQMTDHAWRELGRLRKYPDRPTKLDRRVVLLLVRLGVVRETKPDTGLCVMTDTGQWLWLRHGPVDDRRFL